MHICTYACLLGRAITAEGRARVRESRATRGGGSTRGWRAVSFWSRNQKPSVDAEHSEVKRWSGAEVVVCVTADACEVHTVCALGRVLNSSQAS